MTSTIYTHIRWYKQYWIRIDRKKESTPPLPPILRNVLISYTKQSILLDMKHLPLSIYMSIFFFGGGGGFVCEMKKMTITNLELSGSKMEHYMGCDKYYKRIYIYIVYEVTEWRQLLYFSEMSGIQKNCRKNNMFTVFDFICCNNW